MIDNRILFTNPIIPPAQSGTSNARQQVQQGGTGFSDLLNAQLKQPEQLKFSRHALERLQARNINFDKAKMDKLNDAVSKAAAKGSKESLVIMQDLALVVSVKNRTVITAVDGSSMKDNVFTNIDSAVFTD